MDVPITKPSMVSYADDLDIAQLLENLLKEKHNGFMRITSDEDEGFIIFKDGRQVAAEYGRFAGSVAIEKFSSAMEERSTVIEIFDLRKSHVDYILDVNKPFLLEADYDVYKIIDELKDTNATGESKTEPEPISELESELESGSESELESGSESGSESESESELESGPESESESINEVKDSEVEPVPEPEFDPVPEADVVPEVKVSEVDSVPEPVPEPESKPEQETVETTTETKDKTPISQEVLNEKLVSAKNDTASSEAEPEVKSEPIDRSKLMEKYGIKEMNEDDVDELIDSYSGGLLNEDDVEKVELTLMNKIKKSIFGIPKIKGTEIMVFLDSSSELYGDINIIIEYERKGLLSRLKGESKDIDNLRRQVINIVQIEIKKSFRKFPEIVDKFNIDVEIN